MKTSKLLLFILLCLLFEICQAQWSSDVRLTNNPAYSWTSYNNAWCVAASGNIVHVVWQDERDGNWEIYYKRSTDGGVNWGTDIRLTNNTAGSWNPSVAVSGSVVHVVWQDNRDGSYEEIYYKRNPTGNPVSVKQISSNVPANYSLSQNYPNPFNSQTRIRFDLPVLSNVKLVIYNQLGQELFKLTDNEQLAPGSYEAEFDATNLSSGVYFYRLMTDGFTDTRKMILVR